MIADIALVLGAFVASAALAGLFGASSLGIALSFGQIGFAIALIAVLVRR
jgi:PPE-repeat protein